MSTTQAQHPQKWVPVAEAGHPQKPQPSDEQIKKKDEHEGKEPLERDEGQPQPHRDVGEGEAVEQQRDGRWEGETTAKPDLRAAVEKQREEAKQPKQQQGQPPSSQPQPHRNIGEKEAVEQENKQPQPKQQVQKHSDGTEDEPLERHEGGWESEGETTAHPDLREAVQKQRDQHKQQQKPQNQGRPQPHRQVGEGEALEQHDGGQESEGATTAKPDLRAAAEKQRQESTEQSKQQGQPPLAQSSQPQPHRNIGEKEAVEQEGKQSQPKQQQQQQGGPEQAQKRSDGTEDEPLERHEGGWESEGETTARPDLREAVQKERDQYKEQQQKKQQPQDQKQQQKQQTEAIPPKQPAGHEPSGQPRQPETEGPAGKADFEAKGGPPSQQHVQDIEKEVIQHPLIERLDACRLLVKKGFVPNMRTDALVFCTNALAVLLFDELRNFKGGSMLPALRQVANVAGMPGIVGRSLGMPDIHCGYGFAIGNVCAVDTADPEAVVSPGGVGFDINCGIRMLRTNLTEAEVAPVREALGNALYKYIPVGTGSMGGISMSSEEFTQMVKEGMPYLVQKGLVWKEDLDHVEEGGHMPLADPSKCSQRAMQRGLTQCGTMGAGNHYAEVQVVDEIFNPEAAKVMGITKKGQICMMIHSGSRGLGHQVCSDYLAKTDMEMHRENFKLNDRQLACARINSQVGKDYIGAMCAAANFAFCNRSIMASRAREAFEQVFHKSAKDMDMNVIYDVCHNVAKFEEHEVNGHKKRLLVHRKGATRSFPPGHPAVPECYRKIGQPVLIGGSMGTYSYVLTGGLKSLEESFGSTCHGAGRELSRVQATQAYSSREVAEDMNRRGIFIKAGDMSLIAEEAKGAYKNVTQVVETCHQAGLSELCVRLRPLVVVKG